MKNEQASDETERKSARAATVCLHLNSRSFKHLSLCLIVLISKPKCNYTLQFKEVIQLAIIKTLCNNDLKCTMTIELKIIFTQRKIKSELSTMRPEINLNLLGLLTSVSVILQCKINTRI